jgi:hypothetical protein
MGETVDVLIARLKKYQGTLGGEKVTAIDPGQLPPFLKEDIYPLFRDTYYYLQGLKQGQKKNRNNLRLGWPFD